MRNRPGGGTSAVKRALVAALVASGALVAMAGGSANAGQGAASPRAGRSAIPSDFHAQSMSWVSPDHGWMLGSAPCGQDTCTTVEATTDGGATWTAVGTLPAPMTIEDQTGVTEVRFADDLHGWAFGPALWETSDGGATWTPGPSIGGGRPVVALEGDRVAVFAVASACRFGQPTNECHHTTTLWRTRPGAGSWTKVPLSLPVANQAVLAMRGRVSYVAVPTAGAAPDVLEATLDARTWSPRPDPCVQPDEFLLDIVPLSDERVALLCQANIGFGKAAKRVVRSDDTAQTTHPAGTLPLLGIVSQLSAAPRGTLVVSSFSIGSWIYRNAGGQAWTTQSDLGDGGMGWNDIVFTSRLRGFVIHGPASCCGGFGPGELWETDDGGLSWAPV